MRTVIEKMQRLNQIREVYAEQIKALAKTQLAIHQKVIKELNVGGGYGDERDILRYDFIEIDNDGNVQLWERGRCGDSDCVLTTIYIDHRIVNGDVEGYEKYLRMKYAKAAEEAETARKKQVVIERERLQREMVRISEQLSKLNS